MAQSINLNINQQKAYDLIQKAKSGDNSAIDELCNGIFDATAGQLGTNKDYLNTILSNSDSEILASIMDNYSEATGSEIYKDIENELAYSNKDEVIEKLSSAYEEVNGTQYTGDNDGKLTIRQAAKAVGKGAFKKIPSVAMTFGGVLLGKTAIGACISGAAGSALTAVFGAGAATVATFAAPVLAAVGVVTAGVMIYKGVKQIAQAVKDGKNAATDDVAQNALEQGTQGAIDTGLGIFTGYQSAKALGESVKNVEKYKAVQEQHKADIKNEAQARVEEEQLALQKEQQAQDEFNKPFEKQLSNKSAEESANIVRREYQIQERIHDIPEGKTEPSLDETTVRDLSAKSEELSAKYSEHIDQAKKQIQDTYEGLSSVDKVTGRAKSENSTYEKLASKTIDKKLTSTDLSACEEAIGDAYGTRVKMKDLGQNDVEEVIGEILGKKDIACSYDELSNYLTGNTQGMSDDLISALQENEFELVNALKRRQTQQVVDVLIERIKTDPDFQITELNNYGDQISSYLTDEQIKKIAAAYRETTKARLTVVTKNASDCGETVAWQGEKVVYESDNLVAAGKGAVKESGYTSAQMNTKQTFSDGTVGNGEMQLRGVEVDGFADVEHIPYDIRKGKIKPTDLKYSKVYSTIKSLSPESYKRYNQYLTSVYKALRLRELGFANVELPKIGTGYFTEKGIVVDVSKIDFDGLLKYAHE